MKICVFCNDKFDRKTSESYGDFNKREYCSRECYLLSIKKRIEKKWKPILKEIFQEHWNNNKTIKQICGERNLNRGMVTKRLKDYGFKCRGMKEAAILRNSLMSKEQKENQVKKAQEVWQKKARDKFKTNPAKYISKRGYWMISIPGEGKKNLHHYVWEKNYGKIPEGYVVHHINLDKLDNRIENLQMLIKNEHMKLHDRLRKKNSKGQYE